MSESKRARVEEAKRTGEARRQKALVSLSHCLSRSNVMRIHHDALVHELLTAGGIDHFSDVKKARFAAYVCFWFASLATVVERYQQLVRSGTLPASNKLDALLGEDFINLVKPFRNAVAHCSDHDDDRVLDLMNHPYGVPDRAELIANALREHIELHRHPSHPAF